MHKKTILMAVAILALGVTASGYIFAEEPKGPSKQILFNIPAGELIAALEKLGERTHLTLVYDRKLVEGKPSSGINGRMRVEDALKQLLEGTGLGWSFVNDDTIVLKGSASSMVGPADQMRVADNTSSSKSSSESSADDSNKKDDRNQVVVRGDREKLKPFSTANLDLTRTEDDVLPFTVFTAKDIELSGAANLQEFFQNRLPQNFNADIPTELDGEGIDQQQRLNRVDLRGWGATETVYLLNGRRMGAQYQGIAIDTDNATPNLQSIPLGSIERIEILTSSGSAIYGANATGGVINIITRQDFRGGQLAVNYESPADANAPRRGIDLSYGLPLKWGMSLRLSAGYSDSQPLHAGDRSAVTIERWRQLTMERQPARLINLPQGNPFRTNSQPFGATPNILTVSSVGNLFSTVPGAQSANFTTVPEGYAGDAGLSAFQPGVYNLKLAEGAAGSRLWARDSTLGTTDTNTVLGLGVEQPLGEHWRWSIDYSYAQNDSEGRPSGALNFTSASPTAVNPGVRVPGSAPINPFKQDVRVVLLDPRMQLPELANKPTNVTWSLSSTLHGAVGEWRGFVDLSYSNNHNRYIGNTFWEPYGGWRQAFMDSKYNPFVDVRTVAPASADFYENYIARRTYAGSATRNYQSSIKASGPLFRLPAGAVQLTAGGDWSRSDRYESFTYSQYQDALTKEPRTPTGDVSDIASGLDRNPSRRFVFDTYGGYAEANVPALSSQQHVPLVEQLELFGSARLDYTVRDAFRPESYGGIPVKYTDNSHVYAYGLRYEMLKGMAFRVSRSIGFKPPSIEQVTPYTPAELGYSDLPLLDPRRGDEEVVLPVTAWNAFGNPDLKPETSVSTNIGFIFTSSHIPGLRFSVDYVESIRNDAISGLSIEDTLSLESELPGRVRRGVPDGDVSGLGPITFIDLSYINLNQIVSKGVDFSIEQQLQNVFGGRLVLAATATKNLSFKVQLTPTSQIVEQVRNIDPFFPQLIEWNANGQLRWEGHQWSFGWSTRYFDYILARPEDYILQGGDRAPWKLNHDANIGYLVPVLQNPRGMQWLLSGTSIAFGIKNVFDRNPRFWAASTDRGVAPYDSIMGRSLWLQMRRSF